jgi:nitric oxide reductase NorD protein
MTTSDWTSRLKRGRWLLGAARKIAQQDPRLAAIWGQQIRVIHKGFGWDLAVKAGEIIVDLSEHSVSQASGLVLELPIQLAKVPQGRQDEFLRALQGFLEARPELTQDAASSLPEVMYTLNGEAFELWCKSIHDNSGNPLKAKAELNAESKVGLAKIEAAQTGLLLVDVRAALSHYVQAHIGRSIPIDSFESSVRRRVSFSCDGHRIFLPERFDDFGDERDALSFRVGAAMAAGFVEMGSLDLDLQKVTGGAPLKDHDISPLEHLCGTFVLPGAVYQLFERIERVRVCARLSHRYPGLGRDISLWKDGLSPLLKDSPVGLSAIDQVLDQMEVYWLKGDCEDPLAKEWMTLASKTLNQKASVEDSARLLLQWAPVLMDLLDQTTPSNTQAAPTDLDLSRRAAGEKSMDRRLREIQADLKEKEIDGRIEAIRAVLEKRKPSNDPSYGEMAEFLARNPPPDGGVVEQGQIRIDSQITPGTQLGDSLLPNGGDLYAEWDEDIADYRPAWVRVIEHPAIGGDAGFAERTRGEQGHHIDALRRRFEALRPAAFRRVRGQVHGDSLDLDRVISARVEHRIGRTPSERIYRQTRRTERSVSVAFLIDLSSSTNEPARFGGKRIIDVEKEALLVTAEALDALGDPFAIYGFSGFSREEVAFYTAKDFSSPYNDAVRAKIGGLTFQMENRDGAAIRHAGKKLLSQPAKTRVLFLLSDGKPLDCGCPKYKDEYAQGDTRMALRELRQQGVQVLCITVDPRGGDYLEEVYGKGNYTVVDDVELLPIQLPHLYQRLTT